MILLRLLKLPEDDELLLVLGDPLLECLDLVLHRLDHIGGEVYQLQVDLLVRVL